jgi:hypothetical protein
MLEEQLQAEAAVVKGGVLSDDELMLPDIDLKESKS